MRSGFHAVISFNLHHTQSQSRFGGKKNDSRNKAYHEKVVSLVGKSLRLENFNSHSRHDVPGLPTQPTGQHATLSLSCNTRRGQRVSMAKEDERK